MELMLILECPKDKKLLREVPELLRKVLDVLSIGNT